MLQSIVHFTWNDACEGDTLEDVDMETYTQEVVGFFIKLEGGNYYIARDYNVVNEEYENVLRVPYSYVIDFRVVV